MKYIHSNVLFFSSQLKCVDNNVKMEYYDIYVKLKTRFNNEINISIDLVDDYVNSLTEYRFYVKEYYYQFQIYNIENEYIFCINKPIL